MGLGSQLHEQAYRFLPTGGGKRYTDPKPIAFGGVHPLSCGMVMADGSVRTTDYSIDPTVRQAAASRNDGRVGR
jgi:hypothetical protein